MSFDIVKLCVNTKCNLCWMYYCSICTKGIFRNIFIRTWNPRSSKVNGKAFLAFKRSSILLIPFKMCYWLVTDGKFCTYKHICKKISVLKNYNQSNKEQKHVMQPVLHQSIQIDRSLILTGWYLQLAVLFCNLKFIWFLVMTGGLLTVLPKFLPFSSI